MCESKISNESNEKICKREKKSINFITVALYNIYRGETRVLGRLFGLLIKKLGKKLLETPLITRRIL